MKIGFALPSATECLLKLAEGKRALIGYISRLEILPIINLVLSPIPQRLGAVLTPSSLPLVSLNPHGLGVGSNEPATGLLQLVRPRRQDGSEVELSQIRSVTISKTVKTRLEDMLDMDTADSF